MARLEMLDTNESEFGKRSVALAFLTGKILVDLYSKGHYQTLCSKWKHKNRELLFSREYLT